MAIAHLYCIYALGVPLLYTAIVLFQVEFMIIKPYIIYKAIYNNTFLDKEFLYSWRIDTDNKRVIYLISVSLVSFQRLLVVVILN